MLKSRILDGFWRGLGEVLWGRLRSIEVHRNRKSIWGIFWSSWWMWKLRLRQTRNLFMLYRSILVSGADFIQIMDFWAREGSMFDDFVAGKIDWEIDSFCPARRGDGKCYNLVKSRASAMLWTSRNDPFPVPTSTDLSRPQSKTYFSASETQFTSSSMWYFFLIAQIPTTRLLMV